MKKTGTDAYNEGREAYAKGLAPRDCPYDPNKGERHAVWWRLWHKGHLHAFEDDPKNTDED